MYVIGTYRQFVVRYMTVVYDVFAAFFIFDMFENIIFAESAIAYVLRPVVFFDAFTFPSLLLADGPNSYLNFAFLRAVVAFDSFTKLERRLFIQLFGPRRIFVRLIFQCLSLFYTLAAGIQLLEIPGDLLSVEFRSRWFNFGEWNFVNALYFIIVTLSTVGYGDFSPTTIQGRVFTLFIIIVGIVVFTTVISELVEHASRGRGSGSFVKNSHTRHVIVTGTPTMTDLVHFISEFYSDSRNSNINSKVVVMVEDPLWSDVEWFQHIARNQFLQSRLQFLVGSVRNQLDLQRARISTADAVFILTSPSTGEQPSIQDGRTIINTLAIRNVRTDIPIYAQTLLEDSNLQAEIALKSTSTFSKEDTYFRDKELMGKHHEYPGLFHKVLQKELVEIPRIHKKEGREYFEEVLQHYENLESHVDIHDIDPRSTRDLQMSEHVCLQEVHMALIAGNLQANGVGTLLSNMYLDVRTAKLSKDEPSWLAEYHMGAACSLTYAVVPKELHEVVIKDIAVDLYHLGVLIIATSHPKNVQPRPVLGTDMFLRYGDLVLLLTYHEYKYVCAALHVVALRYSRGELRHTLAGGHGSYGISTSLAEKENAHASYDNAGERGPELPPRPIRSNSTSIVEPSQGTRPPMYANVSADDLDALADLALNGDGGHRGLRASGTSEALREKKTDGYMPDNLKGHIILAMEGDAPLGNLPLLLRNLWRRGERKAMQVGRKAKVVVVHPSINDDFRLRFSRFEGISLFFVQGPPTARATWKKAKLNTAKSVATLADFTKPWSLSDARTIFTLLTLDISTSADHDLFICSELVDEKSLEFLREPTHPRRRGASLGESTDQNHAEEKDFDPEIFESKVHEKRPAAQHKKKPIVQPKKSPAIQAKKSPMLQPKRSPILQPKKSPMQSKENPRNEDLEPPEITLNDYGSRKQSIGNIVRNPVRKLGMDRNQSTGGHKSVKSGEYKSFGKNAVPSPDSPDGESDDFGVDPSNRPGAARARRGTLFSRSRYASGELLVQSSAITLLAREYIEPGFVRFFTSMLGTEASSPGMKIRLVRIPQAMFEPGRGFTCKKGRKLVRYNDVFKILVRVGVTPIGIYRSGVAPVLIPAKVRRKRGNAILDELELLQSGDDPDVDAAQTIRKGPIGMVQRVSQLIRNIFNEIVPQRRREAEGREEIDGKVDDASSIGISSDEEDDPILQEEDEGDDAYRAPSEDRIEDFAQRAHIEIPEVQRPSTDNPRLTPKAQQSSGLPAWLTPRRGPNTSRFFYDDDESLEVPGQVKYTERKGSESLLPYVFTLPDPNTWCAETDGIYIFCHPSFELPSKWSEDTTFVTASGDSSDPS